MVAWSAPAGARRTKAPPLTPPACPRAGAQFPVERCEYKAGQLHDVDEPVVSLVTFRAGMPAVAGKLGAAGDRRGSTRWPR
jgi:hypothetical protein